MLFKKRIISVSVDYQILRRYNVWQACSLTENLEIFMVGQKSTCTSPIFGDRILLFISTACYFLQDHGASRGARLRSVIGYFHRCTQTYWLTRTESAHFNIALKNGWCHCLFVYSSTCARQKVSLLKWFINVFVISTQISIIFPFYFSLCIYFMMQR